MGVDLGEGTEDMSPTFNIISTPIEALEKNKPKKKKATEVHYGCVLQLSGDSRKARVRMSACELQCEL